MKSESEAKLNLAKDLVLEFKNLASSQTLEIQEINSSNDLLKQQLEKEKSQKYQKIIVHLYKQKEASAKIRDL